MQYRNLLDKSQWQEHPDSVKHATQSILVAGASQNELRRRARGARAVEHLRPIVGELMMADVRAQVSLSMFTDFVNFSDFTPQEIHLPYVATMLDQVVAWSGALAHLRSDVADR